MLNTSHSMSGAAAGAWLAVAVRPTPGVALAGVGLATVAAFTPDADHLDARPVRAFEICRWRCKGLTILGFTLIPKFTWRIGPGPLVSWILRTISFATTGTRHRGWTHSLFFAFLLGATVFLVASQWAAIGTSAYLGAATGVGVVAALAGDLVTKSSLNHAFWPSDYKLHVPQWVRITTGGWQERLLVLPAVTLATIFGLYLVLTGGSGA